MRRMQRDFFATRDDIELWLRVIEAQRAIKYAVCGLFKNKEPTVYQMITEIPDLGVMIADNESLADRFLVVPRDLRINVRSVPQASGEIRYAVDQLHNPESLIFQPGGLYERSALICGHIGGSFSNHIANKLFQEFDVAMKHGFKSHREYYVGREARSLGLEGVRLITMHVHEDSAYDLDLKK